MSILCFFIGAAMGLVMASIMSAGVNSEHRAYEAELRARLNERERAYHDLAAKQHGEGEGCKE